MVYHSIFEGGKKTYLKFPLFSKYPIKILSSMKATFPYGKNYLEKVLVSYFYYR